MDSLAKSLAALIADHIERSTRARRRRDAREPEREGIEDRANAIAEALIFQAVAHGFEATVTRVTPERLGEGSTAQIVTRIRMPLSFIFKLDDSPKLVEEARLIRRFRDDQSLPTSFRERFPRVFALKEDDKPFAYLMEDFSAEEGYESLARKLFHTLPEELLPEISVRLINEVLDALIEGYAKSANPRLLPNIKADYLDRISERLNEAAKLDKIFQPVRLRINGEEFPSWKEQLDQIAKRVDNLRLLSPPFVCVVHGDPNPENIMLKDDTKRTIVKFIDPKAWERGDYLFDITKIAHYLWATGPVEQASGGRIEVSEGPSISYSIERPSWVAPAVQLLLDRSQSFAKSSSDKSLVNLRWELGMASNLLGLPSGRWKNKKRDEALILYAEGMVWLDRFRRNFSSL